MKRALFIVGLLSLLFACKDREGLLTSGYGDSRIAGQIVLVDDLAGQSAAGIEVQILETGLTARTDSSGRFEVFGVPRRELAIRLLRPSDGIDVRFSAAAGAQSVIELSRSAAKPRRRGIGHPGVEAEGEVLEVSDSLLKVRDSHGRITEFILTEQTVVRHGNRILEIADLAAGDHVHVKARRNENRTLTAIEVKVSNENEREGGSVVTASGTVDSVGANELVVQTHDGRLVTVKVDESTIIKRQGVLVAFSTIMIGDRIQAQGTRVDDQTLLARKIETEPGKNNGHRG